MRAADASRQIDELFASTRQGRHPGAAVLVCQAGRVLHRQGYGFADLEAGTPITGETAFYLCSLSKAFTATAVMLLAEEGHIGYDDRLPRYFPELPPFAEPMTVRHLLHHTSGFPDYFPLSTRPDLAELSGFTNADVLRWLCRLEAPDFPAGERRQYSNAGYVLLAILVARVSGQPFHRVLQERIFGPLDMWHTLVFDESRPPIPRLAPAYFPIDPAEGEGYRRWDYHLRTAGGGGIFSTLDDLYRWVQALEGERLLSAATYREAYTPGRLKDGSTFGYGFGWELGQLGGHLQIAHTGGLAAYHARLARFPEERCSVVVLANHDGIDAVARANTIAALYLPRAPE